jgi:porphyrinogen peroxidase
VATQPGISALGTPEHRHLELDLEPGRSAEDLVRGVAGGGTDHGTAFVGVARDRWRPVGMLRRTAGATDAIRDGLTGFLTPLTGAHHTCPAVEAPARFAPPEED